MLNPEIYVINFLVELIEWEPTIPTLFIIYIKVCKLLTDDAILIFVCKTIEFEGYLAITLLMVFTS